MMVDLIINIASELLTLLKITEFLTGFAVILNYEKILFFKKHYYLLRNKQYSNIFWIIVMVKWLSSSALCFNNFTNKDCNGWPLKYYRLPREESMQSKYRKIFRTDGMNWNEGNICSAYWSHGERESINDLPEFPISAD